jgi:hypothetical protein
LQQKRGIRLERVRKEIELIITRTAGQAVRPFLSFDLVLTITAGNLVRALPAEQLVLSGVLRTGEAPELGSGWSPPSCAKPSELAIAK